MFALFLSVVHDFLGSDAVPSGGIGDREILSFVYANQRPLRDIL